MTRMIERWFPCRDVSANSSAGWGSGNTERSLFTWFAARPTAQAKAAVVCSLLPWPEEQAEQERLQRLVHEAMTGRYAVWDDLRAEILKANPGNVSVLDPFSGRGMIPLEAARLGLSSRGIDYSPVATLAGDVLADFPFRDWTDEAPLPAAWCREADVRTALYETTPRLVRDVQSVLAELGRRMAASLQPFYPTIDGKQPWGYLWAVTLPCTDCGRRFPLVGDYVLRRASSRRDPSSGSRFADAGQSYYIESGAIDDAFTVVVHDGPPQRTPILANARDAEGKKVRGKVATCPHCGHAHPVKTHQRLAGEGLGRDALLLVADLDDKRGKVFRPASPDEVTAAEAASAALGEEPDFARMVPAVPDEVIPPEIGALVRPQLYGAVTYGDLMCDRQTLATVRLAQFINQMGSELSAADVSNDYARALTGYAVATLVRKLRRSTRGCAFQPARSGVTDLYANQGTLNFSYDFFEAGIGEGPGTWESLARSTVSTLTSLTEDIKGRPAEIVLGSAMSLPVRDGSVDVIVTDPPYDALIYYSDSSDFFFTWMKRASIALFPDLTLSSDARGLQNKAEEIIVWGHRSGPEEHRDRAHYDKNIAQAFSEMRRAVGDDGLVTIVFGHGEPEVWQRLLTAISEAGLVMTSSWPANTEAGGANGGMASIETTLTMACRPAPVDRPAGRKGSVESEIRREISRRYPDWERWGLAPADMLMAAAGPAMEVVGRYSEVRDSRGERVDIHTFLPLARAAVQEAMAVEIDHRPLEAFDARTRFALWWVRLYGREPQAKSELRWQTLASSLDMERVKDLVPGDKSAALVTSDTFKATITPDSAVIDVALALAAASEQGLAAMGEVLASSSLDADDQLLWAAIQFLADRLPDSDLDAIAFQRVLRAWAGIGSAAENVVKAARTERAQQDAEDRQIKLL